LTLPRPAAWYHAVAGKARALGERRKLVTRFGGRLHGTRPPHRVPTSAEEDEMASTRRRKLKSLRMKKANHGKRPLAGK
jgi:hypothetical protein